VKHHCVKEDPMQVHALKTEIETSSTTARGRRRYATSFPPTPVERAIASARWERRGPLGRLVRLDDTSGS
jgi:hypothetical protein